MASICGRVCAHPCETACRRGEIDKPIAIRALKRFLTERYGPESRHRSDLPPSTDRTEKLPFKVAVIGSGPVGLSAAHDLALMGYSVTIFEAAPVAGRHAVSGHSRSTACRAAWWKRRCARSWRPATSP